MPPWSARIEPRRDRGFRAGGTDGRARWGRAVSEGLLSAADQIPRGSLRFFLPFHKGIVVLAPLISGKVEGIHDLEPLTELVECQRIAHLFMNAMVKP